MDALRALAPHWGVLSRLLDEALELPMAERERWLDRLPAAQAELKPALAQMLRSAPLLASDDVLGTLPKWPAGHPSETARKGPDAGDDAQSGDRVGPYRLLSRIGHGAMGEVWRAERADGQLQRTVALKLPRATWGGALAERLRRERDILATLEHPNIARLYDAGSDHLGRPYLAMEYVEGEAIDRHCDAQGLNVRARLRLLLQVAAAVAHAHARLVVHRDLKPSNILVTPQGQVRLLDFGIAKLMEGAQTRETHLTEVAGRAFTLDYASPEQIRGEPLGTGSDVYSLGVVAYELLARAKPYRLKRGSVAGLEEAIAQVEPARASEAAAAGALRAALRGDLDAILDKALQKDAARRYASIDAFAEDIERHLDASPVRARPQGRLYRFGRLLRRHKVPAAALATVVTALSVGFGVALHQTHVAQRNEQEAGFAVDREEAVRALYVETLSAVAGMEVDAFKQPGSVPTLLRSKLDEFEQRYAKEPAQRQGLLEAVAAQLPFMGDHEGTLDVGQRYLALLKERSADDGRILRAYLINARTLYNLGRFDAALALLRDALATVPDGEPFTEERAGIVVELGRVLLRVNQRGEARQVLLVASQRLETIPPVNERWQALQMLGRVALGFDDREALAWMQQAHAGTVQHPKSWVSVMGTSHLYRGIAHARLGQAVEAERDFRAAIERFEEVYGATDRDTVWATSHLAAAVSSQGRYDEARQLLSARQAQVIARDDAEAQAALATLAARRMEVELQFGDGAAALRVEPVDLTALAQQPAMRDAAVLGLARAEASRQAGRPTEAVAALKSWLDTLPPDQALQPDAFRARLAMQAIELDAGRHEPALASLRALIETMRSVGATTNWTYQAAHELAAVAMARSGAAIEAATFLMRFDAAQAGSAVAAPSLVDQADALARRAQVLAAAGRSSEAEALLARRMDALHGQHPQSPRLSAIPLAKGRTS